MDMDIAIKRPADIEVIKHRIYEVRGEYLDIPDVELPKCEHYD